MNTIFIIINNNNLHSTTYFFHQKQHSFINSGLKSLVYHQILSFSDTMPPTAYAPLGYAVFCVLLFSHFGNRCREALVPAEEGRRCGERCIVTAANFPIYSFSHSI